METFGGVLTAFLVAALPLAVTVTKVVDLIRNLIDPNDTMPKVLWNILALVIGALMAVGFEINLLAPVAAAIPALKSWAPDDTMAEILSGLSIGAMAGFWHEKMDEWSARAKAANPHPTHTGTR
jgi:hypothetical protein